MTTGLHVFCFGNAAAEQFARRVAKELDTGSPAVNCRLAVCDLADDAYPLEQVDFTLSHCASEILVIVNPEKADDGSWRSEWRLTISYNRLITVMKIAAGIPTPLALDTRRSIDLSTDYDDALRALRDRLLGLSTPAGKLDSLREMLAASLRARQVVPVKRKLRFQYEISAREEQIAALERADERVIGAQARKASEMERARQPRTKTGARQPVRLRIVNATSRLVPVHFENRFDETKRIAELLRDPTAFLLTVHGRAGMRICRIDVASDPSSAFQDTELHSPNRAISRLQKFYLKDFVR